MQEPPYNQIIIDSHVHFYDSWNITIDQFLSIAHHNLSLQQVSLEPTRSLPVICLLETTKSTATIKELLRQHQAITNSDWTIKAAEKEPFSFWATCEYKKILVISGIQINTSDGLEILLIGNTGALKHGEELYRYLELKGESLLTIIPWAIGKWLGKRKNIIENCIITNKAHHFTLGDNSGRPWFWKNIKPFQLADKCGIPVLAGSDPLPLTNQFTRAGTYGNRFQVKIDEATPWKSIIKSIKSEHLYKFGKLAAFKDFLFDQVKLRL